jgi:hypothetical protein
VKIKQHFKGLTKCNFAERNFRFPSTFDPFFSWDGRKKRAERKFISLFRLCVKQSILSLLSFALDMQMLAFLVFAEFVGIRDLEISIRK